MKRSVPYPELSTRPFAVIAVIAVIAVAGLSCTRRDPIPAGAIPERLTRLERPNLVLIVVDTLRADWTTPYRASRDTAPELARWAQRGVLFERARSESSWTKISMASMFTSLSPQTHGVRESTDGLGEGALMLAELLRDAGYRTYAVQSNGWLHQSFGFHQGFDRYVFPRSAAAPRIARSQIWPHAERVYEEAVRLVDAHDPNEPFFLYLHFMDVHEYAAPPSFKIYGTTSAGAYLAAIRWVDHAVRRVREKLESSGLLDRTVIVLAADHGEAFGENGKYGHARNVLTAVLWTPLLIRFPFPVEPIRVRTQVRNLDIAPTLIELAGLPAPPSFEGRSLLPLVTAAQPEGDRIAHAGLGTPLYPNASIQVSLNDGNWIYARNVEPDPNPAEFLFDRRVDPGENVNLIGREPTQAARMRTFMDEYLSRERATHVLARDVRIDPSIAQRLRAMGYLQ
jgi:arylsulfatase A-like enzyme